MTHSQHLYRYFTEGAATETVSSWGAEVETFVRYRDGQPADAAACQSVFDLFARTGWRAIRDGEWINSVVHQDGTVIKLEQGYHCLEVVSPPLPHHLLIDQVHTKLQLLYRMLDKYGLEPVFKPLYESEENLLAPEDPRSALWLELDGVESGNLAARTASVQFTKQVTVESAIPILNQLNAARGAFLHDYPQAELWHEHMATSFAGYRHDRFGGPGYFCSLQHYCSLLAEHSVIVGQRLVPFAEADLSTTEALELFVKSVWWFFRLKRYGDALCIEVRPLPRRHDAQLIHQLQQVRRIMSNEGGS